MAVKMESKNVTRILFAVGGCLALCFVIAIVGGVFLWTQLPKPETQTVGVIPQPAVAITAQTIDQIKELYRIPQPGYVHDVAWSPDGLILASAVGGTRNAPDSVQLWDAVTGRNLSSIDQVEIFSLVFSPDGQMLAGAGNACLIIWNVVDRQELINIPISYPGTRNIAFSPDSQILAYEFQGAVHLLEMPGGHELKALQKSSDFMGFVFLPNGQTLITTKLLFDETSFEANETAFTVWDVASGQEVRTFTQPVGINEPLATTPDGKLLARRNTKDGEILIILDMESGQELQSFSGFRMGPPCFAFSPDGSVLATSEGTGFESAKPKRLRLFNVMTGREAPMLEGHTSVIYSVGFSPNGRLLATASEDKTVRLWGVPPQAAP